MRKKNIRIINLGGTITAKGEEGSNIGYQEGTFSIETVLRSVYRVEEIANITYEDFLSVASADITLDDLLRLGRRLNQLASREDLDGFVLTHGTDTLEETAYFLHLCLKTQKPVVITGAMRPATSTSADGPLNLYQSVVVACDERAAGQGVLVVFSDAIYSAREVQKVSTFHVQAFSSRDLGCLGYVRGAQVYLLQVPHRPHTQETEFTLDGLTRLPTVEIIYFSSGASLAGFRAITEETDGLVLAGAGDACISRRWREEVKRRAEQGLPIVRASRVATGITIYDEQYDGDLHSIPSNSLPPHKARILLMLALTKTKDLREMRRMFEVY